MRDVGETLTFAIGDARLTRVPYFDGARPPEAVGLTAADLLAVDDVVPDWCDADGSVRVGQVCWVISIASLWPAPGAAQVTSLDPIRFTPAWP